MSGFYRDKPIYILIFQAFRHQDILKLITETKTNIETLIFIFIQYITLE